MKIIVISLPKSLDRRAKLINKLDGKAIEYEILDAVDGRVDDHPYLKNYDENKFLLHCRRKAAPGELGCYVSHMLAWERCIVLGEPVVVLEDDFEWAENFLEGLAFIEQFISSVEFVRLEKVESIFYLPTPYKNEHFALVKQIKVGKCMTGYAIAPSCARALLAKGKMMCLPVDLYLRYTVVHKQLIYALLPPIVRQDHAESTIGLDLRQQRAKGFFLKFQRFTFRWSYAISSLWVNLVNALIRS